MRCIATALYVAVKHIKYEIHAPGLVRGKEKSPQCGAGIRVLNISSKGDNVRSAHKFPGELPLQRTRIGLGAGALHFLASVAL